MLLLPICFCAPQAELNYVWVRAFARAPPWGAEGIVIGPAPTREMAGWLAQAARRVTCPARAGLSPEIHSVSGLVEAWDVITRAHTRDCIHWV